MTTPIDPIAARDLAVAQDILKIVIAERPRISENEFVAKFLPVLANVNGAVIRLDYWIEKVSKSPYAEVDVVDTAGNKLFTVPPLLRNGDLYRKDKTNLPFSDVANLAHTQSRDFPHIGNATLLNHAEQGGLLTADLSPDQKAWQEILIRYGYQKTTADEADVNTPKADSSITAATTDEYDDF